MSTYESENEEMSDEESFSPLFIPDIIRNTSENTLYEQSSVIESVSSNRNSRGMIVRDCLISRSCSRKWFPRSR